MSDAIKCTVEDGKHVRPCKGLDESTEGRGSSGRERGIRVFDLTKDGKPSRTFYAIKSEAYPGGLAINFCPFCGAQIDAPFSEPTQGEQSHD